MQIKSYLVEQNIQNLNTDFALFYGENLGLKNEFKKMIKINNQRDEFLNFDQNELLKNSNIIINELSNFSLFQKKKIIYINNATDKILEIVKEIYESLNGNKVFIFAGVLEKKSKIRNFFEKTNNLSIVACYSDNEITIKNIIQKNLKSFNGLTPANLNTIIENSNLDRIKLYNELEKIKLFFSNKLITEKELQSILDPNFQDNFNLLKDAALLGRKEETNKLLSSTILESEKNIYYLNLISQRLIRLYDVIKEGEKSSIENALNNYKPPIFWKDKPIFLSQINKWSKRKIKLILKDIYHFEIKIKSNSFISKEVCIKKLLLDLCSTANS